MKLHYALLIAMIMFLAACEKGEEALGPEPVITFVSVSPSTVVQYTDSLIFTIEYTDGDGDLGSNDPDSKNLYLTDSRNNVTYQYRVKELAPAGSTIAITGTLSVVLDNVGLINGSTSETATFDIYVTDRAGNQSNTVTSSEVTINP